MKEVPESRRGKACRTSLFQLFAKIWEGKKKKYYLYALIKKECIKIKHMEAFILLALILLNGVLSMSEIALVSARKTKFETEAKKGNRAAKRALKLSEDPDSFLSTIQIGITLIGILTGLYSGDKFAGRLAVYLSYFPSIEPYALTASKTIIVVIVTYLTLIWGELVPKRIGMSNPEQVSLWIARPMYVLSWVASPFVWILSKSIWLTVKLIGLDKKEGSKVTEEEIKAIVKEGYNDGEVQEVEQDIVDRVFTLGDRRVDSIMTHRGELVWLDVTDSLDEMKKKIEDSLFDIYPVSSESLDDLLGVVYLKDLFLSIDTPGFSLKKIVREAKFVPENQSVYTTLEQFKEAKVKYSLVADEFGNIQGIVTLKDIMEGLVGQVPEQGEEQYIVKRADDSCLIDGQCPFYDFLSYFDKEELYAEHDYNTLSGLILEILGRLPRTGEKLNWMGLNMEIVDMDGARIDKVLVRLGDE